MTTYVIDGMTCDGCARAVARVFAAVAPGMRVNVDRAAGRAEVEGEPVDEAALRRALDDAGFSLRGRV
jgi:copper chaperone